MGDSACPLGRACCQCFKRDSDLLKKVGSSTQHTHRVHQRFSASVLGVAEDTSVEDMLNYFDTKEGSLISLMSTLISVRVDSSFATLESFLRAHVLHGDDSFGLTPSDRLLLERIASQVCFVEKNKALCHANSLAIHRLAQSEHLQALFDTGYRLTFIMALFV